MRLPVLTAAALLAVLVQPTDPALAAICVVNPYQAYLVAQPRGWTFHCTGVNPARFAAVSVLREPPNGLGCLWRTGSQPSPVPRSGVLHFFGHSGVPGANGALRNGWQISAWELSGDIFVPVPDPARRINAHIQMLQPNRTYRYRVSRLVLSRQGGNCANAIQEAF